MAERAAKRKCDVAQGWCVCGEFHAARKPKIRRRAKRNRAAWCAPKRATHLSGLISVRELKRIYREER